MFVKNTYDTRDCQIYFNKHLHNMTMSDGKMSLQRHVPSYKEADAEEKTTYTLLHSPAASGAKCISCRRVSETERQ